MGRPPWALNLKETLLFIKDTHTKPKELAAVAYRLLEDCKNQTGCNPACWSHAKLYLRLPKLGYLAAFHEWFRHHIIYGAADNSRLMYTEVADSRGTWACPWVFSVRGGIVKVEKHCAKDDWWTGTIAACLQQTDNPALPIMSKNWQNFWLRHAAAAAVSSPRHLERELKSVLHQGFTEFLNGIVHKSSEHSATKSRLLSKESRETIWEEFHFHPDFPRCLCRKTSVLYLEGL